MIVVHFLFIAENYLQNVLLFLRTLNGPSSSSSESDSYKQKASVNTMWATIYDLPRDLGLQLPFKSVHTNI